MTIPVPRQIDAKGDDARPIIDVQAQLVTLIDQLNRLPILDGRLIDLVPLSAGVSRDIPHGLARLYRGWIIVRVAYPGAGAAPVQEASGNPDPALFLRLHCAQPVTLSLWVF